MLHVPVQVLHTMAHVINLEQKYGIANDQYGTKR